MRKALLEHDKTYNQSLDFINNPPHDCDIVQLCPPEKLKSKRDSKNIEILKADYKIGKRVAEEYLNGLENWFIKFTLKEKITWIEWRNYNVCS